ncbi:MAG: RecQ family ATP-dependent DNA helicase, partial [Blastocatellia bacterium]
MELEAALQKYFGFQSFRSGQREVIDHVLAGRDVLAVLPTGLGKSLCYQLPAQLLDGITLVISPLIALMRDQVEALRRRGFKNATFLNSSLDGATQGTRYDEIEQGWYKLVYVAPERCDSPRFRTMLSKVKVGLFVIDEAHCISQWGHDFRPHYRTMLKRLPELQDATVLAMTATATAEVRKDIIAVLGRKMEMVVADFNRPNLVFDVVEVEDRREKDARLLSMVRGEEQGAVIVYASTRKEAEAVCTLLRQHDVGACVYHAGLASNVRTEAYHQFQQGKRRVIVATVAFGMGIDKPNVRRVIHYNITGSL